MNKTENKINLKVKGMLLVNKTVLRDAPLGTKGFLMTNAISIYADKVYLNTITSYSATRHAGYTIPFERTNEGDFELSFENMIIIYVESFFKPDEEYWAGPFEAELKEYSLENYYVNMPLEALVSIWNDALDNLNSPFEKGIREIKRTVFRNTHEDTILSDLLDVKEEINSGIKKLKKSNASLERDDYTYEVNLVIIEEYHAHKKILDDIYKDRTNNLPELEEEEFQFLTTSVNVDSSPEELTLAGEAKKELRLRQSEDIPVTSEKGI